MLELFTHRARCRRRCRRRRAVRYVIDVFRYYVTQFRVIFFFTPLCRALGWRRGARKKVSDSFLKISLRSAEKVCALLIKNYINVKLLTQLQRSLHNNRGHTLTLRVQHRKSSLSVLLYINVIISDFRLSKVLGFSAYLLTNSDNE